jgi:hypothetical protein
VRNESPILRDLVLGTGGRAKGMFTFTSSDNLTPPTTVDGTRPGVDMTYGDMDYHQDYWSRETV